MKYQNKSLPIALGAISLLMSSLSGIAYAQPAAAATANTEQEQRLRQQQQARELRSTDRIWP